MAKQEVVFWVRPDGSGDVGYGQVETRRAGDLYYVSYNVFGVDHEVNASSMKEALVKAIKRAGLIPVDLDTL